MRILTHSLPTTNVRWILLQSPFHKERTCGALVPIAPYGSGPGVRSGAMVPTPWVSRWGLTTFLVPSADLHSANWLKRATCPRWAGPGTFPTQFFPVARETARNTPLLPSYGILKTHTHNKNSLEQCQTFQKPISHHIHNMIQLNLEWHGFELHGFTYTEVFQ